MALSTGYWVTKFTFVASSGVKVVREHEHHATDFATVLSAVEDLRVVYAIISKLTIAQIQTSFIRVEQALTLPVGAFPEDILLINAPIKGNAGARAAISIPAPKDELFMSPDGEGHNQPNFANGDLSYFLSLFHYDYFYVSDGQHIGLVDLKGKRVHRKTIGT